MGDFLKGADFSAAQGGGARFTGLVFVILKAQQGNDGFDPWFLRNCKAAVEAGCEPFAYCFVYPLPHLDPKAQAKLFVDSLKGTPVEGRPIFLDLEWPAPTDWARWGCAAAQISEFCRILCEEVKLLSGRTPVIYTYPWWWKTVGCPQWAADYPLWLASYTRTAVNLAPWAEYLFWQYDGDGGEKLSTGVDCDFDLFNGDKAALQLFIEGPNRDLPPAPIVHPEQFE